ncbi:putative Malectin/receptor-like protein kinase family protein [Hibiscus syriacus]|uniref:Malectin/receptor-like protein kinase family protein n=1 Tax=Hibiscus syriacus TaxID=106335 RepID=A0A6A2Z0E5_HIBSY|nr:putative Malectin/receptor-like protein kinase family protein [Hibiscus syriacus]
MNDFTKKLSVLTLFHFTFLHTLTIASSDGSPKPYALHDNIALDCGSTANGTDLSGRSWITDNTIYLDHSNKVSVISASPAQGNPIPYSTARLSRSEFTYSFKVTPGPKFIRLHFYPTSYHEFDRSSSFFDVHVGGYTLLRNFSASLAADDLKLEVFYLEFCLYVDEGKLNMLFSPNPNVPDSYAFVNGIQITSMPGNLYYTSDDDTGFNFMNQVNPYRILKNQALQTLYRVNVGGSFISPEDDTGMYRSWFEDGYYLTNGGHSVLPVNLSINPSFSVIPNYSAPTPVYKTARTMGQTKLLHFCEFQREISEPGDRVFQIYIDNIVAEHQADVISWAGGRGVPVYRDYAVMIGRAGKEMERNISIAVHPAPAWRTKYSDAILNGVEIFKLSNEGNLAGSNPQGIHISPPIKSLPPPRPKYNIRTAFLIVVGIVSAFVTVSALYILIFRPKSRVEGSSSWYELSNKDYSSVDRSGKVYTSDGKHSKDTKECDILLKGIVLGFFLSF